MMLKMHLISWDHLWFHVICSLLQMIITKEFVFACYLEAFLKDRSPS